MTASEPQIVSVARAMQIATEHFRAGQPAEAEQICHQILQVERDNAEALRLLGNALKDLGRLAEADQSYRRALELEPNDVATYNNRGIVLAALGSLEEAERCYGKALVLNPEHAMAHGNLGNVWHALGEVEKAARHYRRAVVLDPTLAPAYSNLLYSLNYLAERSPAEIYAEHREFDRQFCQVTDSRPHGNSRDPDRRLRIGYVSGDFRDHSVSFFVEPVLAKHDRSQFEIFCYSNFSRSDAVTQRLRSYADHWREVHALGDEAMASLIREDAIDILVDLSGHTANNRLPVFGRKPAPVQVTYLGYPGTTGLAAMDYRLTDSVVDPEGEGDRWYSERLVRLPDTMWCYRPHETLPEVTPAPALSKGYVTFGSLNHCAKLNPQVFELWAQLLASLPESRLIITRIQGERTREQLKSIFKKAGVAPDRIELHDILSRPQFGELFSRIDVALDPFPYGGTTTTCDVLWMGIPLVTFAGGTTPSRSGACLLRAVDLGELVAQTPEQYLKIAGDLAHDSKRLSTLRAGLRERMRNSILMDDAGFTRNLENAYRVMWRSWCQTAMGQTISEALRIGLEHLHGGRLEQAEEVLRGALVLSPGSAEAHNNLGVVVAGLGRLDEAEHCYRQALALKPGYANAHANLGVVQVRTGRLQEAESSHRKALELKPESAEIFNNLGVVLAELGRLDEAEHCYRQSLALMPAYADAHNNLGNALRNLGRTVEAEQSYRHALALKPDAPGMHSNRLSTLNCIPGWGAAQIYAEHREFERRFCRAEDRRPHGNSREPDRRLRVGYASGDFRDHSVSLFIEPILARHAHGEFEVFCYSNLSRPDAVTQRLQSHADHWREVHTLGDEAMANLIHEDAIDILVDLSGHTANNRLPVFGRKPAPVQVTYLGYPGTTGLAAMDYRLTDAAVDPEGEGDRWYSERLIRLPDTMWCYRPHETLSEVTPAPCLAKGFVTFGSLNHCAKLNPQVFELWARLLARLPASRLVVTSIPAGSAQASLKECFAAAGVGADRLEIYDRVPRDQFNALVLRIDIALDPFPYGGTTTTCDAMWKGIPVVSLSGGTTPSRSGVSLLNAVGFGELVAHSAEAYLEIAAGLARDQRRLAALRFALHERMRGSTLVNAGRFTRNLEKIYRTMWQSWCSLRA